MTQVANPAIGFDIGGSKTEIIVLDGGSSAGELHRRREPTPKVYGDLLALVRTMVFDAERVVGGECTVGIGAPGSPNPASGLHRNSNLLCLNGNPFAADLERELGRAVRVTNDANCMTLSEAMDGAAAGARTVFGVIIGTGVGGGVVVNGEVLDGCNGIAGEWGHIPMPGVSEAEREAAECYCGRRGCVEQFLGGPAVKRRFGAEALEASVAEASVEWYAQGLARALGAVVNTLDPDVIVLAGGLSKLPGLEGLVQSYVPRHAFSDTCCTKVVRAKHGDSSGVRGAARLS